MKKILKKYFFSPFFCGFSGYTAALFAVGMIFGSLFAFFFTQNISEDSLNTFSSTLTGAGTLSISSADVSLFAFQENCKCFALLFFFSFTNVFRIYHVFFFGYTGFSYGLFLEYCILSYGPEGILTFVCCCIPHCLILVFVYLSACTCLDALNVQFFQIRQSTSKRPFFLSAQKRQLFFRQLPFLLRSFLFLLLASLAEGYVNLPLLQIHLANK